MIAFVFISVYFIPVLAIVFCLNLVEVLKKIKNDQATGKNTFWLTLSFMLIVWSIAVTAALGS
ncbi:hypothetical protein EKG37_16450 [Robertmurraya yapensis]|uniref:PCZ2.2 n=1 Tax=Bacillus yapensis TaxID=2492960 RepID=A0A3S0IPT5_9BACI|nr:hypothetical protein [Bacillus yapensis]RTR28806.1 hypothetical protein EKG37_16450 [Bacillus yapensis]TKS94664.1 hypothetical protein FAR12_16450 [Bacillus yapensis]